MNIHRTQGLEKHYSFITKKIISNYENKESKFKI